MKKEILSIALPTAFAAILIGFLPQFYKTIAEPVYRIGITIICLVILLGSLFFMGFLFYRKGLKEESRIRYLYLVIHTVETIATFVFISILKNWLLQYVSQQEWNKEFLKGLQWDYVVNLVFFPIYLNLLFSLLLFGRLKTKEYGYHMSLVLVKTYPFILGLGLLLALVQIYVVAYLSDQLELAVSVAFTWILWFFSIYFYDRKQIKTVKHD